MSGDPSSHLHTVWPLLLVRDITRSLAFYRDQLGFDLAGEARLAGKLYWVRLQRGDVSLMLQQAEAEDGPEEGRGRGVSLYFLCGDSDALQAEFRGRGLVLAPPTIAEYGMKQLFVPDPDGYSVCFESPLL